MWVLVLDFSTDLLTLFFQFNYGISSGGKTGAETVLSYVVMGRDILTPEVQK